MNRKSSPLFLVTAVIGLGAMGGCAHRHVVDGRQERSEIPAGVRVGIGGKEVREGDSILVFRSVCKKIRRPRGGELVECKNQIAGKAVVLKVLDHDSAIVDPKDGLVISESMTVEKEED